MRLDGKAVTTCVRFAADLQATVDGVPVAAVYADRGGASYYDGAYVLFAAPPGKPVVTGRVEQGGCKAKLHVGLGNGQIVIVDPPVPAKPQDTTPAVEASRGAVWLFDAAHGAVQALTVLPGLQGGQ